MLLLRDELRDQSSKVINRKCKFSAERDIHILSRVLSSENANLQTSITKYFRKLLELKLCVSSVFMWVERS